MTGRAYARQVRDYRAAPELEALREQARAQRVAVYISGRDQRNGLPFVHLRKGDLTLAEFRCIRDAAEWLGGGNG